MNIAIIGAGFTGLSAALHFLNNGHNVTLFEKDTRPGGLAVGFKKKEWEWTLEEHYHHWFANDKSVLDLARSINFPVVVRRPKTSVFVKNNVYQLDSPLHVLRFPLLNLFERMRMASVLGFLRFNPIWKPLEKYNTDIIMPKLMGRNAYEMLWKPQLTNKFGKYYKDISLAWFWARVYKRTSNLVYPKGGYLAFAEALAKEIRRQNGVILYHEDVRQIKTNGKKETVETSKKKYSFDAVLVTSPNFVLNKLTAFPEEYVVRLTDFKGLGAINVVLRLKKEFMQGNTYWLSICDPKAPIMAVVEHTHFMDKKHYNNEHVVYIGNYMEVSDKRYKMSDRELFALYTPYLKKINPQFEKYMIGYEVFRAPFAQPIITPNYSQKILPFETPIPGVFLANMQHVYPWDRGTNYAVELGERVSGIIMNKESENRA